MIMIHIKCLSFIEKTSDLFLKSSRFTAVGSKTSLSFYARIVMHNVFIFKSVPDSRCKQHFSPVCLAIRGRQLMQLANTSKLWMVVFFFTVSGYTGKLYTFMLNTESGLVCSIIPSALATHIATGNTRIITCALILLVRFAVEFTSFLNKSVMR